MNYTTKSKLFSQKTKQKTEISNFFCFFYTHNTTHTQKKMNPNSLKNSVMNRYNASGYQGVSRERKLKCKMVVEREGGGAWSL